MKKHRYLLLIIAVFLMILLSLIKWNNNIEIIGVNTVPDRLSEMEKEGLEPFKYIQAYVVKITDGDTIEVLYKREKYDVRLLCIDTPESVKNGVPIQPFAHKASKVTEKLTLKKKVTLLFEKQLKDKYGRLLAHVFVNDGQYINAVLVKNGFARVQVIKPNELLKDYFYKLQNEAIKEKRGFWNLPEEKRPFVEDEDRKYIPRYWIESFNVFLQKLGETRIKLHNIYDIIYNTGGNKYEDWISWTSTGRKNNIF